VLLLTLGTGIGSALFVDGKLVPNTEFGHLNVGGAKRSCARRAGQGRRQYELDAWADQLNLVLKEMHALLWPDFIVLCGGITEEPEKFMHKLHCEARLSVGVLRSEAGIVGARCNDRGVIKAALAAWCPWHWLHARALRACPAPVPPLRRRRCRRLRESRLLQACERW